MTKKKRPIIGKWFRFINPLTMYLKDRDIASGRVEMDYKNMRWRFKK